MIKLIISDVDGTLLPEGTAQMNPKMYETILKIKEQGITFVAASGRPYQSVHHVFEPVDQDIYFISDNGACSRYQGKITNCFCFDKDLLIELLDYCADIPDVFLLASTANQIYTNTNDLAFIKTLKEGYSMDVSYAENLLDLDEPVIKFAIHFETKDAAVEAIPIVKRFGTRANIMASGAHWVDFMPLNVDKGTAVERLQQQLGITKEETMAFGDNHNDLGMLARAGESYAVANAREDVKTKTKYVLLDEEDAVLHAIEKEVKISHA